MTNSERKPNLRTLELQSIPDGELLRNTIALAAKEREILIELLHHLLEIDSRKLFSPRFTSIHAYAEFELGYSSDQAWRRVNAMRLLKEVPEIEIKIADASLNLTSLAMAQSHFRSEGTPRGERAHLLEAIAGKSTRAVERELISRSSEPDRTRLESVRPVSQSMNEVKFYVNDETLGKIEKLKGRMAHTHPYLTNARLFETLLDQALEKTDPSREPSLKRQVAVAAPLASLDSARKRSPSAKLKRELFRKAENRCESCGSIRAFQTEHVSAFALGGLTVAKNMKVLCRVCNERERIRVFDR